MLVFLSFLVSCFCGAALLRGRPASWRVAFVACGAVLACGAYFFLHAS